jgi:hypothetical protein
MDKRRYTVVRVEKDIQVMIITIAKIDKSYARIRNNNNNNNNTNNTINNNNNNTRINSVFGVLTPVNLFLPNPAYIGCECRCCAMGIGVVNNPHRGPSSSV